MTTYHHSCFLTAVCILAAAAQGQSEPPRGYLGIYAESNRDVLDSANAFDGITVTRVVENSPGYAAGVKVGDIVLEASGVKMTNPNQLYDLAETLAIGSAVKMRLERDNEILELTVVTVNRHLRPDSPSPGESSTWRERRHLGFEFGPPDPDRNRSLGLAPREGIRVLSVAPNGPMSDADIAAGAIVLRLDDETIHSPKAFLEMLESKEGARTIRLALVDETGATHEKNVRVRKISRAVKGLRIPPIVSYEHEENSATFSMLLGLFKRERIGSAVEYRILWFFTLETGEKGELLDVGQI